ncbi:L-seryl-tRNA(Sec) kinase-like [Mercenaria mercenaria]|uniref:L-seryl-tRNA(Sec) kinase-like n=1 Tax=Mercenaria mercenaria TaxID=6596 RepID=UPI00234F9979|nr:L-seryl-tRNA(Sec) kinase-like [Mercenaria mercenaria]XP_053406857.1 L-seryl-tRNA(Sec) kinase-like [Mercenaria mercenaria]
MADICLVLLCGLPGSGKTYLSKQLQQQSGASGLETSRYIIIEYDRLLPQDLEKILIQSDDSQESKWKSYRADIVKCVDSLIESIKKTQHSTETYCITNVSPEEISEELWEKFIYMITDSNSWGEMDGRTVYIVIDDNMYYRSMRYSYYQLARKYEIGFCQIYLQSDVETAISQNASRVVKVADDVISTMATKMEAPDWSRNSWEENSISFSSEEDLKSVFELFRKAVNNPVQTVEEVDVEQQEQSRVICSESFVYQSDLILRRLVSQQMSLAKENSMGKVEMKSLAGLLQTVRKQLLDSLKSGTVEIPRDLVTMATDSSKDTNSALYQFLDAKFHSYLKEVKR